MRRGVALDIESGIRFEVENGLVSIMLPAGGKLLLNETASFAVNKIARGAALDDVAEAIAAQFEIDIERAMDDLQALVAELESYGVLMRDSEDESLDQTGVGDTVELDAVDKDRESSGDSSLAAPYAEGGLSDGR